VNNEDDRRRKGVDKHSRPTDVVTSGSDSFRTKTVHEKSLISPDDDERERSLQTGVVTTKSTMSESFQEKNIREEPDTKWSQRILDEPDTSKYQTDVITTKSTMSESFQEKNIREEPDTKWSQHILDEPDTSKYQTAADEAHSSMTEESWELKSKRSTHRDTSSILRMRSRERSETTSPLPSPSSVQGGMRCQAVDSEQLVVCSHEERRRYYISAVVDPRNGLHLSVKEVITFGNFKPKSY